MAFSIKMEMDPSIRMLQLSQQSCHCPASPGCLATHLPCLSRNAGRILQRHWSIPVLSVLSSTAHLCSARAWQSPVTFSSDKYTSCHCRGIYLIPALQLWEEQPACLHAAAVWSGRTRWFLPPCKCIHRLWCLTAVLAVEQWLGVSPATLFSFSLFHISLYEKKIPIGYKQPAKLAAGTLARVSWR